MTEGELAAEGLMRSLFAQRTPTERLRMCARMFSTARALALAGMTDADGPMDASDQRRRLFLRFYGDEFTEPQRGAVIAAITGLREAQ